MARDEFYSNAPAEPGHLPRLYFAPKSGWVRLFA